jgi:hypothetical protein
MVSASSIPAGSIRTLTWPLPRLTSTAGTTAVCLALVLAGLAGCRPSDGAGQGDVPRSVTPTMTTPSMSRPSASNHPTPPGTAKTRQSPGSAAPPNAASPDPPAVKLPPPRPPLKIVRPPRPAASPIP